MQRAAQAEDPYFHEVLYNTLIDLRAVDELLSLETSRLPEHLRINGGLPSHPLSGSIGPLTQSQVQFRYYLSPCTELRLASV